MSAPEWVQPGQQVAISSGGWRGSVSFDTITRVLKRDIVLESGRRFAEMRGGIFELGQSGTYYQPRLLPPDDQAVLDIQRETRIARARNAVSDAHEAWWRTPTIDNAATLTASVAAWVELQEVTQ